MVALEDRSVFAIQLRSFREKAGRSRNSLALEIGVDPSYLARIEYGDREPPSVHIVEALCRGLRLTVADQNRLLVAAGYAPLSVAQLGYWDDCLQACADVLTNINLTSEERAEFRQAVILMARNWRHR